MDLDTVFAIGESDFGPDQKDGTIATVNSLTSAPMTVAPGAQIHVGIMDSPGGQYDWVAIFAVGGVHYMSWKYLANDAQVSPVQGVTKGIVTLTAPVIPGTYEARLLLNNSYTPVAASGSIVVANSSFMADEDGVTAIVDENGVTKIGLE